LTKSIISTLLKANFAISKVTTRSAINPILWLVGLISISCFILATISSSPLKWVFIIIGCTPLGVACFSFIYLLFKKPDYLRSEEFHIRKFSLEHFGEKGIEFTEEQVTYLESLSKPIPYLQESDKEEEKK